MQDWLNFRNINYTDQYSMKFIIIYLPYNLLGFLKCIRGISHVSVNSISLLPPGGTRVCVHTAAAVSLPVCVSISEKSEIKVHLIKCHC